VCALLARAPDGFRTVLVDRLPEFGVMLLSQGGDFPRVQSGGLQEFEASTLSRACLIRWSLGS
jgi:hypothetical protein